MKLRLVTGELRLRLSPEDLSALKRGESIHEEVRFGPENGQVLRYSLTRSTQKAIQARFMDREVTVSIPTDLAATWLASEEESLAAEQVNGTGDLLHLLIEKDRGRK